MSGTVAPSLTSRAYRSAVSTSFFPVSADSVLSELRNEPPFDAARERNGWMEPAAQLVMTPKPCRPDPLAEIFLAAASSSSHVAGGLLMPASWKSFLL